MWFATTSMVTNIVMTGLTQQNTTLVTSKRHTGNGVTVVHLCFPLALSHGNRSSDITTNTTSAEWHLACTTSSVLQQSGWPTLVQGRANHHAFFHFFTPSSLLSVTPTERRGAWTWSWVCGWGVRVSWVDMNEHVCMMLRVQMGEVSPGCVRVM